jgi:hypothetical protein
MRSNLSEIDRLSVRVEHKTEASEPEETPVSMSIENRLSSQGAGGLRNQRTDPQFL